MAIYTRAGKRGNTKKINSINYDTELYANNQRPYTLGPVPSITHFMTYGKSFNFMSL